MRRSDVQSSCPIALAKMFVNIVKTTEIVHLKHLKYLANNLGELGDCSDRFLRKVSTELLGWLSGQQLEIIHSKQFQNKSVILFKATYFDMKKHWEEIENVLRKEICEEVHFLAKSCLKINQGFFLSGKNVVVAARDIYVADVHQVWDVSGLCAASLPRDVRASDGTTYGEDGCEGLPGEPGESGGNLLIYCENIHNGSMLTIKSNGGNGGNGQNGGNGKDGKDGKDGSELTEENFDHKFPPVCYYGLGTFKQNRAKYTDYAEIKHNRLENTWFQTYQEMEIFEGNGRLILSVYQNPIKAVPFGIPTFRQGYCIAYGAEGTMGQKGGDGGVGGNPGLGGYAGEVSVNIMSSDTRNNDTNNGDNQAITIVNEHGDPGEYGESGEGGYGGYNGRRGKDIGRMEPGQLSQPIVIQGRLEIQKHKSSNEFPYCAYEKSYVEIARVEREIPIRRESGCKKDTRNHCSKIQKHATRKKPIVRNDVMSVYATEIQATISVAHNISTHSNISATTTASLKIGKFVSYRSKTATNAKDLDQLDGDIQNMNLKTSLHQPQNVEPNNLESILNIKDQLKQLLSTITNSGYEPSMGQIGQWMKSELEGALAPVAHSRMTEEQHKQSLLLLARLKDHIFLCSDDFSCDFSQMIFADLNVKTTNKLISNQIQLTKGMLVQRLKFSIFVEVGHISNRDAIGKQLSNIISQILRQTDFGQLQKCSQYLWRREIAKIDTHSPFSPKPTDSIPLAQNLKHILRKFCKILDEEGNEVLFMVLAERFSCQQCNVTEDFLQIMLIAANLSLEMHNFCVCMIAVKPRTKWLSELTAGLARKIQFGHSEDTRLVSNTHIDDLLETNQDLLLLFTHKLCESIIKNTMYEQPQFNKIDATIQLLKSTSASAKQLADLQTIEAGDWWWKLSWYNSIIQLRQLSNRWTSNAQLYEAAFYILELINRKGMDALNTWQTDIAKNSEPVDVLERLTDAYNEKCNATDYADRTLDTLQEMIKTDSKNSEKYKDRSYLEQCFQIIHQVMAIDNKNVLIPTFRTDEDGKLCYEQMYSGYTEILIQASSTDQVDTVYKEPKQLIYSAMNADDIKEFCTCLRKHLPSNVSVLDHLTHILAVVYKGIQLKMGISLRATQLLAIVLFLKNSEKGLLQQVSTGEGKSVIIVALAIVQTFLGNKVDVITSSPVLALRDASDNSAVYDLFGITVAHNCSLSNADRQKAYMCDVVYGEIGAFQRDQLLDTFYGQNVLGSRSPGNSCVIVDEVDSMVIDKGENMLYLSHSIAGLEVLEPIYVWIWNLVNSMAIQDKDTIRKVALKVIFGVLTKEDLKAGMTRVGKAVDVEHLWNYLVEKGMINGKGEIIQAKDNLLKTLCKADKDGKFTPDIKLCVVTVLKDILLQGSIIDMPSYLKHFIEIHLDDWIESAKKARFMLEGENYVIDIDRTEANQATNVNIVIMDTDTGTEQYNSQWCHGLHQFLQLKHGCRINYETLKAVFMSNISFFKQYQGKLYGLTGTLGSVCERDLLQELYNIEFVNIPTFRPMRFTEEPAVICTAEHVWIDTVVREVRETARKRPVLVICDTVRSVDIFLKEFKADGNVHKYTHSYHRLDFWRDDNMNELDTECIILATNIAGRGTDIRISPRLESLGGLHVCLTYLPNNCRVEQQAFGRAARKGDRGSGRMIILDDMKDVGGSEDPCRIFKLRIDRNRRETEVTSSIKCHYTNVIMKEEEMFKHFTKAFQSVQTKLIKDKTHEDMRNIILQSILDKWAFYLDDVGKILHVDTQDSSHIPKVIHTEICNPNASVTELIHSVDSPVKLNKLGLFFSREKNYDAAIKYFDISIAMEPEYSEAASYYKAYCLIRKSGKEARPLVSRCLLASQRTIQKRIDELSCMSTIVHRLSQIYRTGRQSFILLEDYKMQKQDKIEIYEQILMSIRNILGRNIDGNFMSTLTTDVFLADQIHKILLREGHLSFPKVVESTEIADHKRFWTIYEKYKFEICQRLEALKQREYIDASDFEDIIPSKEGLWNELANIGAIENVVDFIVLDADKLQRMQKVLHVDMIKMIPPEMRISIENVQSSTSNEANMCFEYKLSSRGCPDIETLKSDNYIIIDKNDWICYVDNTRLSSVLMENNYIYHIKKATVNISKADATRLSMFDSIETSSFVRDTDCQIKPDGAKGIVKYLQENNVLSHEQSPSLQQMNLTEIPIIPSFEAFQTEILNTIHKSYAYRLAIAELSETADTSLESSPHHILFNDLIEWNLVQSSRLKESKLIERNIQKTFKKLWKFEQVKVDSCITTRAPEPKHAWQLKDVYITGNEYLMLFSSTSFHGAHTELYFVELWNELHRKRWLRPTEESLPSKASKLDHIKGNKQIILQQGGFLDGKFRNAELYVKSLLLGRQKDFVDIELLKTNLQNAHSAMADHFEIDAHLAHLGESFDSETQFRRLEELNIFYENGFDNVIVLHERKWTWMSMAKTTARTVIGTGAIITGVIAEMITMGKLANITDMRFIRKGITDLTFAAQNCLSGLIAMKSYLHHKALCLATSVSVAGISNVLSRGAQFSKFGIMRVNDFSLFQKCTKRSIIGQQRLLVDSSKRISQRITQSSLLGLTTGAIELAIESCLRDLALNFKDELLDHIEKDFNDVNLPSTINELFDCAGAEHTSDIITNINNTVFFQYLSKITVYSVNMHSTSKAVESITEKVREVCKTLINTNQSVAIDSTSLSKRMTAVLIETGAVDGLHEVIETLRSLLRKTLNRINLEMKREIERFTEIDEDYFVFAATAITDDTDQILETHCKNWKSSTHKHITNALAMYFKRLSSLAISRAASEVGKALKERLEAYKATHVENALRDAKLQELEYIKDHQRPNTGASLRENISTKTIFTKSYYQKMISLAIINENSALLEAIKYDKPSISPDDVEVIGNLTKLKLVKTDTNLIHLEHIHQTGRADKPLICLRLDKGQLCDIDYKRC